MPGLGRSSKRRIRLQETSLAAGFPLWNPDQFALKAVRISQARRGLARAFRRPGARGGTHFRYHVAVLEHLERYLRKYRLVRPGERVGVAVSGGADSVALLRAFAEVAPRLGIVLFVLHLNHNLRGPESEGDARFVGALAAQLSLEAAIEGEDVASLATLLHLSLEAAGRRARYGFFQRAAAAHRLDCVATAHSRDDQAETVLLRLLRGAGTSGLAGIHRSFDLSELDLSEPDLSEAGSEGVATDEAPVGSPRLIRPLLSISRQEIEEFLGSLGQPFRQDASNLDPRFLRNRVRAGLLPEMEHDYNPRLREALCETAEIAAAEDAFLEELVSAVLGAERELEDGVELELLRKQPLALQRRILRRLCRAHSLALSFAQIEALREFALAGHAGRINLVRGFAAEVVRAKFLPARLCLLPKQLAQPGSETYCFELPIPGTVSLSELWRRPAVCIRATLLDRRAVVAMYNRGGLLSSERVGARLTIRNLCPGDRFRPLHSNGECKVNRLLQELSIPAALRRRWPVALAEGRIVWVPGLPVASDAAWVPGDGEAALVETCSGEDAISNDSAIL